MAITIEKDGYGQVEPNHLSAPRDGGVYAQLPAAEDIEVLGDIKWHEYQELHKDKPVYTGEDLEFLAKDNAEKSLSQDLCIEYQ